MRLVTPQASLFHSGMLDGELLDGRMALQAELCRLGLEKIPLGRGMRQMTIITFPLLHWIVNHLLLQLGNDIFMAFQAEEGGFLFEKRPADQTMGTVTSRTISFPHGFMQDGAILSHKGLILGMTVKTGLALPGSGPLWCPCTGKEKRNQ